MTVGLSVDSTKRSNLLPLVNENRIPNKIIDVHVQSGKLVFLKLEN